jgi:hypothetical protein
MSIGHCDSEPDVTPGIVSAQEAIDIFTAARGEKQVFSPSHIRWIRLYYELLSLSSFSVPISIAALGVASYTWTLDSIELGPTKATLHAISIRRRNQEIGVDTPLPELFKQKVKSPPSAIKMIRFMRRKSEDNAESFHRHIIRVDFPPESRFSSREDCEFVLHMRKNSFHNNCKICFWFPAEMSDQMLNHRMSSADGNSTLYLTSLDLDHPEDADKTFNVRTIDENTVSDSMNISSVPNAYQRFYVKINVRYTKL